MIQQNHYVTRKTFSDIIMTLWTKEPKPLALCNGPRWNGVTINVY